MIVIDQGNLHKKDIDLKFPSTWELAILSKATASHLNKAVDFIRSLSFWSRTYSESPQNTLSYDILHVYVLSEWPIC